MGEAGVWGRRESGGGEGQEKTACFGFACTFLASCSRLSLLTRLFLCSAIFPPVGDIQGGEVFIPKAKLMHCTVLLTVASECCFRPACLPD